MIALILNLIQNLPLIVKVAWKLLELYRAASKPDPVVTMAEVKEVTSGIATAATAEDRQKVAQRISALWVRNSKAVP